MGSSAIDNAGEWAIRQSILAYGLRLGIRTNRPEFMDRLSQHFPPLWKPSSTSSVERMFSVRIGGDGSSNGKSAFHELFENRERGEKSRSLNAVLEDLERRMKMYVAEMARRRVFVHAGVVGWNGKAIIVPGRSLSGKTTLIAELVRAGATYYSDEYAVLDMNGLVHPYPQLLQVREPGSGKQKKRRPEEIGGVTGTKPLPVGLVAVSPYRAGARWRPRRLSTGQAVLELLANTVPARRRPEVVMPTLHSAVTDAIVLKGARGEADRVARLILEN